VILELERYAKLPFIGNRKPKFVYFGGGTPSYLSSKQLQTLGDAMKAILPWDEVEEVTFECEPGTLTEAKLKAIREMGVTRLSLGVENFDKHILEINGRAHRAKEIGRAYEAARNLGFPQINIDLISGMLEETDENWNDCIQKAIAMEPDSITIYQMEIPFNTTIYKRMQETGQLTAPVADWQTKRDWVKRAFAAFEQVGYHISSAYTAVKDSTNTQFMYRDALWHGADLLSLGVSSFSHINHTHFQNQHNLPAYLDQIHAGELPIYRALKPSQSALLVRELVLQLKLGHLDPAYFQKKFDVDIRDVFQEQFDMLRELGFLVSDEPLILLNRDGLLQIDRLLHQFFLPEHQNARYA
jgi:oxygen-independent coproporphyrinogen-3 oxidase